MSNGADWRNKADKKANSSPSFFSFSSNQKFEDAHELYINAANAYIIEKSFKESGDCFYKAAEMALKSDEKDDAAGDFWKASKSYKKVAPECEF